MTDISLQENIVSKIFEAMNSRNFSVVEGHMTDKIEFDFPGAGKLAGKRRVLIFLNALLRKYPKLTFSVTETILGIDSACAIWTNEGKDLNGEPYRNRGITLIHFADNKISFLSDYFKDTSFIKV